MLTSRRRLADANDDVDTGVSASSAEQVWATLFLVVIIIMLLCLCLVCCCVFAQFVGCGSFLGKAVLACCRSWCGAGGKKKKKKHATPAPLVPEAKVVGPAPIVDEEQVPLNPQATPTKTTPARYTCFGLEMPCLAWFGVCGCSFVGCAWLSACWTRLCGGGRGDGGRGDGGDGGRGNGGDGDDGLSLAQNVLTCWRCFGILPLCCPAQYTQPHPHQRLQNGAIVATPLPIQVVRGTPVNEEDAGKTELGVAVGSRPMPTLNLARRG